MTFLSIIIPIYNMERYLPECLASLQRQNFEDNVEILLIDDGSKDGSSKICDAIGKNDRHFRVFHQENRGVAATRNRGLHEARGKYVAWVDPDDYITDNWWEVIRPVLEKSPDLVYFDMTMLQDGHFTNIHYDNESRMIECDEWFRELANNDRIMSHLWSKIFLRTLFDQLESLFDEQMSYCEDYQIMHRVTLPIRSCVYLHECLYVYRQLTTSIVHDELKVMENAWLNVKVSRERRDFYRQHGIQVSNYGFLYASFSFCDTYLAAQEDYHNPVMEQRYKDCLIDLRREKHILLNAATFSMRNKVILFLMLNHLRCLIKPIRLIKHYMK